MPGKDLGTLADLLKQEKRLKRRFQRIDHIVPDMFPSLCEKTGGFKQKRLPSRLEHKFHFHDDNGPKCMYLGDGKCLWCRGRIARYVYV
jgi:hypothetical protein